MAEDIRAQAQATLKEVEAVTTALLPEPKGELIRIDVADAGLQAEIAQRKAEIDIGNTQSIIRFGSAAQAELQVISQDMLAGVRNKDVGPAGRLRCARSSPRSAAFRSDELDLRPQAQLVGAADRLGRRRWPSSWRTTRTCRARSTRSPTSC